MRIVLFTATDVARVLGVQPCTVRYRRLVATHVTCTTNDIDSTPTMSSVVMGMIADVECAGQTQDITAALLPDCPVITYDATADNVVVTMPYTVHFTVAAQGETTDTIDSDSVAVASDLIGEHTVIWYSTDTTLPIGVSVEEGDVKTDNS